MVLKIRGTRVLILAGGFGVQGREDWSRVKILAVDSTRDTELGGRPRSPNPRWSPRDQQRKQTNFFSDHLLGTTLIILHVPSFHLHT